MDIYCSNTNRTYFMDGEDNILSYRGKPKISPIRKSYYQHHDLDIERKPNNGIHLHRCKDECEGRNITSEDLSTWRCAPDDQSQVSILVVMYCSDCNIYDFCRVLPPKVFGEL